MRERKLKGSSLSNRAKSMLFNSDQLHTKKISNMIRSFSLLGSKNGLVAPKSGPSVCAQKYWGQIWGQ